MMETNVQTRQNIKQAVPFFAVSDMQTSLSFYVDGLGFKMASQWMPHDKVEWCWLQRDGAAMMLQESRKEGRRPVTFESKPGEGVSICFVCEDALELYQEFISKGVKAAEPFVGNAMWDVGVIDPDGYHLHFESYTDVPEETKYSEWKR